MNNANRIMGGMKEKANKQIEDELKEIAKQKAGALADFFVKATNLSVKGDSNAQQAKIEFLVNKFVQKLKIAVQNRKSETINQQHEKIVEDLLKKHNFRKGMKQSTLSTKDMAKAEKRK